MDMGDIKGYILAGGHIKALPHTFSVFPHHFFDPDQNASSLVSFFFFFALQFTLESQNLNPKKKNACKGCLIIGKDSLGGTT